MMRRIAVVLGLFFCIAVSTFAGERVSILRIIDGDTLRVWDGETETTVRLLGIDTPETRPNEKAQRDAAEWGVPIEDITRAGGKAKAFVIAVAPPGIEVGLAADGVDAYGRTLAYVTLPDGRSLNTNSSSAPAQPSRRSVTAMTGRRSMRSWSARHGKRSEVFGKRSGKIFDDWKRRTQ